MLLSARLLRRSYTSGVENHALFNVLMACVFPHRHLLTRKTIQMQLDGVFTINNRLSRHLPYLHSYEHTAGHRHTLHPTHIYQKAAHGSGSEDSSNLCLWFGYLVCISPLPRLRFILTRSLHQLHCRLCCPFSLRHRLRDW